MTKTTAPILARLQKARVRLAAQRFLDTLSVGTLAAASILVIVFAVQMIRGAGPTHNAGWMIGGATLMALMAALLATAVGWPTFAQTAALLDDRAGTHDRFHTALDFGARERRTPLEDLTLIECLRYAETFHVKRWTPFRAPRPLRYLTIPLLLGGCLLVYARLHPYHAARPTALDGAVAQQAHTLQTLADRLRQNPDSKAPELDKVTEEMKNSAKRLQEATTQPDTEKLKSALRELSSLEAMLQAMKDAARGQKSSPEEMAALTAALAANEPTRGAADALKAGDPAQAGAELEKLLQQLQQQGDLAQTLQQLAQSMQEQAAKLTAQEKNEVAQQMQQAAQAAQAGQSDLSQQSLQRLAQLLKKMGANKSSGGKNQPQQASAGRAGASSPMTEQQLQQLINALENMKEGLQQPGGDGQGKGDGPTPGSGSLAMVESFSPGDGKQNPGSLPSGAPGSERDQGRNDKIFDDKAAVARPTTGAAKRLQGMPGEGESAQELVNTAGDSSKAGRAYRQLYEAAAPAARDAVEQENIPLGSRRFVRRYFENIRPQN